jgi:hypothetical protein
MITDAGMLGQKDPRRTMPRFQAPHFQCNLELLQQFAGLAREAGVPRRSWHSPGCCARHRM